MNNQYLNLQPNLLGKMDLFFQTGKFRDRDQIFLRPIQRSFSTKLFPRPILRLFGTYFLRPIPGTMRE